MKQSRFDKAVTKMNPITTCYCNVLTVLNDIDSFDSQKVQAFKKKAISYMVAGLVDLAYEMILSVNDEKMMPKELQDFIHLPC